MQASEELGVCAILGVMRDEFLEETDGQLLPLYVLSRRQIVRTYKHGQLHLGHILLEVRNEVARVQCLEQKGW